MRCYREEEWGWGRREREDEGKGVYTEGSVAVATQSDPTTLASDVSSWPALPCFKAIQALMLLTNSITFV